MTQPPIKDEGLIETISEAWCGPEVSEQQSARLSHALRVKLMESDSAAPMIPRSLALAFSALLVILGMVLAPWPSTLETPSPALEIAQTEETLLDLLATEDSNWDEDYLPDDYAVISQLID